MFEKKIKNNIKDASRHEAKKVKKSIVSSCGTEDVYKLKLKWFDKSDSFLRNVLTGRKSISNLVSTLNF